MKREDGARLGTMAWPELWHAAPRPVLVVPVGSCEQHGPHLPLDTDTRSPPPSPTGWSRLRRAGDGARPFVLAPALTVTASGEHAGFPGTLSIGTDVFERVVVELVRSADWSGGVVLVNGHGGNAEAVGRAVATLRAKAGGCSRGGRATPAATPTPGPPRRR